MNECYLQILFVQSNRLATMHPLTCLPRILFPRLDQITICSDLLNIHSMNLFRIECLIRPFSLLNLPPNLGILVSINLRSGQLRRQLIPANNDWRVSLEEAINIFQRAIGSFWVEEIGDRDKSEAYAGLRNCSTVSFGRSKLAEGGIQVRDWRL
jgi:hypothetical protein